MERTVITNQDAQALATALNALGTRLDIAIGLGKTFNGERDLIKVFGYKQKPTYDDYLAQWARSGLFARAIDLPINATWDRRMSIRPTIEAGRPASQQKSTLESAFNKLRKQLKLHSRFVMLDRMLAFSPWAVLFIGIRGVSDLAQPQESRVKPEDVLFLQPYPEKSCKILEWEDDISNERFGQPRVYEIAMTKDPNAKSTQKVKVHWSRVIHAADEITDNVFTGTPRALRLLDRAEDMLKVVGGAAEMFFQGADRVPVISARDGSITPGPKDIDNILEETKATLNRLRRVLYIGNAELNTLGAITPEPLETFTVLVSVLAASAGIPQRIFIGSERGELASEQDRENWSDTIDDRRSTTAEPVMLEPTVDRFMQLGALPAVEEWETTWPSVSRISQANMADHWQKRAQGMSAVSGGAPELYFSPGEIRSAVGYDPDGAPDAEAADVPEIDEGNPDVQAQFQNRGGARPIEILPVASR